MSTLHNYYMRLHVGGTFKKPVNESHNAIEYAVTGATGYPHRYPHLQQGKVIWLDEETFKIQCKVCGQ